MSLRLVADSAERAAAALERLTAVPAPSGGGGDLERDLVDLLRRAQAPELVDELKKALG